VDSWACSFAFASASWASFEASVRGHTVRWGWSWRMNFERGLGRTAVAEAGVIGLGGLSYPMMQHLAGLGFFASLVTDKRDQI
jgi:hypothetical protein